MSTQRERSPKVTIYVLVLFLLLGGIMVAAIFVTPSSAAHKPISKNIIVLIADGRGFNHVRRRTTTTMARKRGRCTSTSRFVRP